MDNRKLSSFEQAMEILNRCGSTANVATIGRISGPLNEETVRLALDCIQNRHPRLNSRIVGDLDNLCFEMGAKKIPLRVANKQHEGQWQEILLEELNAPINSSEVLLRAALIKAENEKDTSHLLITIHHSIADALSSIPLYSELLTYCQQIAAGELHTPKPPLKVLPPVNELLLASQKGLSSKINIPLFMLRLQLQQRRYQPQTLNFEKTLAIEERSCDVVCRQLDADFTQKLVNICRQENTSVSNALSAAMLLATASKIKVEQKTYVSCHTSVDLRRRFKPAIDDENLGALASGLTSFHNLNTSFWELARDVKKQLEVSLNRDDIFSSMLIYRMMTEYVLKHSDRAPFTVLVSNIGQVNIPKVYGQFELLEISFVSAQIVSGGFLAVAITTFDGKMFLNFPFSKPALSKQTV